MHICTVSQEQLFMANRTQLRIAVPHWYPWAAPWATECASLIQSYPDCQFLGSNNKVLSYLLELLKIDYELVPMPDLKSWGTPPEWGGIYWSGLLGELQNGTIDAIATCYVVTEGHHKTFSYSYPVMYIPTAYVFQKSTGSGYMMALFHAFSMHLWLVIATTCLTISSILTINSLCFIAEQERKSVIGQASESLWTVISFITDQCHEIHEGLHMNTHTCRLAISWLYYTRYSLSDSYKYNIYYLSARSALVTVGFLQLTG